MSDLSRALALVRSRLRQPVDRHAPESFDPELVEALAPLIDRFCRLYYRLEVEGLDNVPDGRALLVGNHNSGTMFLEAVGVGARWYVERGTADPWHGLAHDLVIDAPVLGRLLCRVGALRAGHETAARAFAKGRKVIVFPGGNREAFRAYSRRNEVDFYGRTGFVRLALRHRVPIVPMVFIGGQEGFVILKEGKRISRWLGAHQRLRSDAWPLWLGLPWGVALGPWPHLPLPVKCVTRVLPPISLDDYPAGALDDPEAHREIYDTVVSTMQRALDSLASARRGRF